MKIIIPMAGRGSRLRPHTLTTPKPLVSIAGKPIVQRLVEDIISVCREPVDEIAFVVGDFGAEAERNLKQVAENLGAKGSIYYQEEALGTAHAIMCAAPSLTGKIVVAFADTLFKAEFTLDGEQDGIVWVKKVGDPSQYGVIKTDASGAITGFFEKPEIFISDQAIIGIYYFKEAEKLRDEMQYLLDNKIKEKGEYQLTNALENLKKKGTKFVPGPVEEWLDCGNKNAAVFANQRVLEHNKKTNMVAASAVLKNSTIHQPCYIGENVRISNATVGPHVSIGDNTVIENSTIKNTIIQTGTLVQDAELDNSMIGNHVKYKGQSKSISVGDYCSFE